MLQKNLFILINVAIGPILLYTYYRTLTIHSDISHKLWGGVPQSLTPYIIASMFIGALGYFFFTYYLIFEVNHQTIRIFNRFDFSAFIILYLFILIPSSFWINLCINYILTENLILWKVIVVILYIVGISSFLLLLSLININPINGSILYKLAICGCACFTFHTMFLDGLLWTIFFHK